MKVSVIIPAYNEEKLLGATLARVMESMEAFKSSGWETELIVCDNNSNDQTAAIAAAAGARVVFEPVNQISRARNRGASVAAGDWLVFIDADSLPSPALFQAVVNRVASGKVLGGGTIVTLHGRGASLRVVELLWKWTSRSMSWAAGAFVFVQAEAFRAVGGFSNNFYAGEEVDLSKRLKAYGRAHGRRFVIITEAPLVTSARKLKLYSGREYLRLFARLVWSPKSTLASPVACHVWYDGRR